MYLYGSAFHRAVRQSKSNFWSTIVDYYFILFLLLNCYRSCEQLTFKRREARMHIRDTLSTEHRINNSMILDVDEFVLH